MYRYCDYCDKHVEDCGTLKRPFYLPSNIFFCRKCNAKTIYGKTLSNKKRCWKCNKSLKRDEKKPKGLCEKCFKKRILRNENKKRKHIDSYFERQRKRIYKDRKEGMLYKELSKKYGMSEVTMRNIYFREKKKEESKK